MLIRIKVIYYLKLLISIKTQNQKMLVKQSKKDTLDSLNALFEGRKWFLILFKVEYYDYTQVRDWCGSSHS